MKTNLIRNHKGRKQRGVALVIILAMVVLLTVVVLAYFSRTLLSRQSSNSSANEAKADFLAKSGLDVVVGDLKQEIAKGSTVTTTTNGAIVIATYTPTTNTYMTPQRSGVPAGTIWPIPNLIRRSAASDPIVSPGVGSRASAISSTNISMNNRYISPARWNSHYLIPRYSAPTNAPSTPDSTLNFIPPDWVLVTRAGPSVQTAIGSGATALNNPDLSNQNYVIGRYAYAIYTEGGLLDLNAAGFPSGLTLEQIGQKGTIALADLTKLPIVKTPSGAADYLTQNQVDQIVGWRNYYSAQPSGAFGSFAFNATAAANWLTNFVQTSTNGFLTVTGTATASGRTDQAFLSRQGLIKIANSIGLSPNALQYLGTFSRELNAPSWAPTANASTFSGTNNGVDIATGNPIPNNYAYKDNADTASAINRKLYGVLVQQPFTRLDGSTATKGEPLIKTRFDLNKVAWITHDGTPPAGVQASDILKYFGLTWKKVNATDTSSCWVYNHGAPGSGTRIMTLDEVAQANREPDFFELLQAGILQGSLGLIIGDPTNATDPNKGGEYNRAKMISNKSAFIVRGEGTNFPFLPVYAQEKYQVIQIGANIIDQADRDSFPTEISLNQQSFYGVENIPYFNTVSQTALRPPEGGAISPNQYQAWVHQWLTFSLWNPHQNASIVPSNGPTNFRIFANHGIEYPTVHNLGTSAVPAVIRDFSGPLGGNADIGAWVSFKVDDFTGRFSEPTTLDYAHTLASEPNGRVKTGLGWSRAGIYLGASYSPDITAKVAACAGAPFQASGTSPLYDAANIIFSEPMALNLQYQDPVSSAWHTYAQINGLVLRDGRGDPFFEFNDPAWNTITVPPAQYPSGMGKLADNDQEGYTFAFLDPRSARLNLPGRRSATGNPAYPAFSCETFNAETGLDGNGAAGHFPVNSALVKAYVNNVSSSSYYTDRDFVRRMGDAAGWLPAASTDPLIIGNSAARPVVLDRPFRNVGELGYVFRDDAWKSLNLFSAGAISGTTPIPTSADSALLDIFCIGPSSATIASPPAVVAGKVDLNSASAPVLSALMAGAVRDYTMASPFTVNTTISLSDSQAVAADIVAKTKATPFASIAELPGAFPQQDTTIAGTKYPGNAEQREAMIRGVADSAGTRTWNLMIDIIAQSGKYGPAATDLNSFIVEGERRYWLHIAIDRFTGQIVGQQLELVTE